MGGLWRTLADSTNRLTSEDSLCYCYGMYGKHFSSMYEGSMIGAGAVVFAVMGYVIANGQPDRAVGTQVELNPKLLAFIFGEPEKDVESAIDYLCSPDPKSRTDTNDGRRLVRLGQFAYQVVNGAKYRAIRDEERRRETDRESKRRQRAKAKGLPGPGTPLAGEAQAVKALNAGDVAKFEKLAATPAAQLGGS